MDDLLTKWLGPFTRHLTTVIAGWLVGKGIFTEAEGADFVVQVGGGLAVALGVLFWSIWQKSQAAKLTKAALNAQPGTSLLSVKARAGLSIAGLLPLGAIVAHAMLRVAAVVALALITIGCGAGQLKAPPELSPVGDIAFYAHRVSQAVDALQQVAIDGEASGAIERNDARAIVDATTKAQAAAVDLAQALKAGLSETSARSKAVAVIRNALGQLPDHLSPGAQALVAPYINTALVLLTVFV